MSQYNRTAQLKRGLFATLFLLLVPLPLFAHVKWFSAFTFTEKPLMLQEIFSPMFFWFAAGSILTIVILVYVDEKLTHTAWYHRLSSNLSRYADKSNLIIRVATGAVLLLSWQANALLVPELIEYNVWIELAQLALAILILSNRLIKYAGFGLILLYLIALFKFGAIHLFDYVYLVGAGYYLAVSESDSRKLRASALPALYASVGFSLCWVALEKIVYPGWALQILTDNPVLTFGMDLNFFLMSAAFVEFSLGFLLIVCMLQRPIALAVTVLFMSTTPRFRENGVYRPCDRSCCDDRLLASGHWSYLSHTDHLFQAHSPTHGICRDELCGHSDDITALLYWHCFQPVRGSPGHAKI